MALTFGGNTANFGLKQPAWIFLLQEDVANLAVMAYEDSVRDYYLFQIAKLYVYISTMLLGHLLSLVGCFTFKSAIFLQCFC